VTDEESTHMAHFLIKHEGLFVGSSSALHLVACVKAARKYGEGLKILTMVCDGGARYLSKFYNDDYMV
jgi:cysteine synthase